MCARPAFCMYCYESRGTDVDHFVPIARDPAQAFEWTNHILACGYCNQHRETIDVLRLNSRSELVEARYRSWRGVIRVFAQAAQQNRTVDRDDVEDLRFLPVVDAFHHFAHDVAAGRLGLKSVAPELARHARRDLPILRSVFPGCRL